MGQDYIVRATAAKGAIRAFAITSRNLTEEARRRHHTSPVVTAALGRLLAGGAMMGVMMKGEQDLLTVRVSSDGPLQGLTVTADSHGNVKGYPVVPDVMLPPNSRGKLDVAGAVGAGILRVVKDLGMKEPYVGQTELQTGEIAEDLTYYFAVSEQVPSSVGLGVLMNRDNTVRQAGGFLIQLMPGTGEEVIDTLEQKIAGITSVTDLLEQGHTPQSMLEYILGEFGLEVTDTVQAAFRCDCSRERVRRALAGIGEQELRDMIQEGKPIEVNCHFCGTSYIFETDDLKEILEQ